MKRRSEIEHVDIACSLLQSCNSLCQLKQIHAHIFRSDLHQHYFLASCLVDLYASLSFPRSAHDIVSSFSRPNISLFNRAIRTFSKIPPLCLESLRFYCHMVGSPIKPDNFTYPFLLNSCAALCDLSSGTEIHGRIVKNGFCSCIPVSNALIDMYGKCKELGCARIVFDEMRQRDVVSYNALLGAHGRDGKNMLGARMVFDGMPVRNVISWNALVVGYVNSGDLSSAREIFDEMPDRNVVTWTTMLVGYTKNGQVDLARVLFNAMPQKTLVCWTAMISAYAQNGRPEDALAVFFRMERAHVKADAFTMTAVVPALAQLGRPDLARWITAYIDREGIERNERVLTALVDMHAKCGNIDEAYRLFEDIPHPDVYPYSALITGLASHGHGMKALETFHKMQMANVEPDYITFVGVLTACRHTGLVEDGLQFWESMKRDYKIEPDADHYACLVDMLGRAGRLHEAYKIVKSMPMGPYPRALGALLSACRTYGDVKIAENVAEELFKLEPENTGNYVLLSGIYAAREQWDEAARVRKAMKEKRTTKLPGSSCIEINRHGKGNTISFKG
ncbi:hypothetical protein Nepgr_023354 [Nepenthes gracilis]|uniref:Pentatricopeptide repeat-containing protein n=1 Tax=Nepenthes gracilis TaxID=150966 RepID=A0AAD3T3M9_NEPGR|nr:hypothetical protein Nepgr_023354 [Nepenthes gracilis]